MPTNYNLNFMAKHPLSMTFNPPEASKVLDAVAKVFEDFGMEPVTGAVARADNATTFTEFEGQSWLKNAPDDLILGVAKMLDGFVAQMVDPESDVMTPDGGGPWDEPSSVWTAEAFLAHRKVL